jgi:hypothetical protein
MAKLKLEKITSEKFIPWENTFSELYKNPENRGKFVGLEVTKDWKSRKLVVKGNSFDTVYNRMIKRGYEQPYFLVTFIQPDATAQDATCI